MCWGTLELEGEVVDWLDGLDDEAFGQAERYIDLLADEGAHLGERARRRGGSVMARRGWDEVKGARAHSPDRRRGYEKAGRAIRLAMEIRALREARGLSQRELAERVGTTQSAIARLEGGNISPSLPTLDKIAEALEAELSVSLVDLSAS
jgi:ribosome-binding protein aMBF1 (putative translation factor)